MEHALPHLPDPGLSSHGVARNVLLQNEHFVTRLSKRRDNRIGDAVIRKESQTHRTVVSNCASTGEPIMPRPLAVLDSHHHYRYVLRNA